MVDLRWSKIGTGVRVEAPSVTLPLGNGPADVLMMIDLHTLEDGHVHHTPYESISFQSKINLSMRTINVMSEAHEVLGRYH
jgi:hypothetical protein